jgi:Ca2+-binding RTX toxin-like protein
MATLTALNNYSIDMADWNLHRIHVGAYGYVEGSNESYGGVVYPDVVGYAWNLNGSSNTSIFGGNFTTAPNELGTPVPTSGTVTGYLEQFWNGSYWESYFDLIGTSVNASQIYSSALTPSTADDYSLFASMLSGNDTISGSSRDDTLYGYAGTDGIVGGFGNDTIDGGAGTDTVAYLYTDFSNLLISKNKDGGYTTVSATEGTDVLTNIEILEDRNDTLSISTLYDAQTAPTVNYLENGVSTTETMLKYDGVVNWLDFYFYGDNDRQTVTGTDHSEFMNLLGGTDAVDGRGGDDVLDGGLGSNFMTGGTGEDTFFIDGRGAANTWSTITDLTTDDAVTLWGWQNGTSQLIATQENQGASGFKGVTYFYDLDGDGSQETKLTFTGLTDSDLNDPSINTGAAVPHLSFSLATSSGLQLTLI